MYSERNVTLVKKPLLALGCALSLAGCSAMQSSRNEAMDQAVNSGSYASAAQLAESRLGIKPTADGSPAPVAFVPGDVLDHLDAAEAWHLAGNAARSIQHFDAAEQALRGVETQGAGEEGARQVGAVLVNDSVLQYTPSPAEAILINYNKALDFWKQGDLNNVRVELNRAGDRTRRAVEHYESEIAAAQAPDAKVMSGVSKKYADMSQWTPYREFVVPPATYLQALYLGRSADPEDNRRGSDLLQRLAGIIDSNPTVLGDVQESQSGRLCPKDDCVWILVEHGLGPTLVERRIDVPIVTPTGLVTASMALPALVSRPSPDLVPFRTIVNGQAVEVPLMASMDRVVQVEFQKRFPGVVTRAVASATTKAAAQVALNKVSQQAGAFGSLISLAGNIASAATTSADVRMWRSMPGKFSLVRVEKTPGFQISLETSRGTVPVEVPEQGSSLIYIEDPVDTAPPAVSVLPL
jgi:hypothetical protein